MRNTLITVATTVVMIVILYANISKADENIVSSNIKHIYEDVTISKPYEVKECYFKEVPVYSELPSTTIQGADVVTGMLLGGLLGKVVTGKDKGAVGGAMLGGVLSATPRKGQRMLRGHMKEEVCHIRTKSEWVTTREYMYSLITFETSDGHTYELQFQR
tara:strand:+ start:578 stop:1057 length:480 start_codon:yes stop_codon:yes gene_type:complete